MLVKWFFDTFEKGEQKFYLIEWEANDGSGIVRGRNHYYTNLLHIDYQSYLNDLRAADMLELEGF